MQEGKKNRFQSFLKTTVMLFLKRKTDQLEITRRDWSVRFYLNNVFLKEEKCQ